MVFGTKPSSFNVNRVAVRYPSGQVSEVTIGHSFVKVHGVTFENSGGHSRQEILEQCQAGEMVKIEGREHNARYGQVLGVYRWTGEKLGFIQACEIGNVLERAINLHRLEAYIHRFTGANPFLGIDLILIDLCQWATPAHLEIFLKYLLNWQPRIFEGLGRFNVPDMIPGFVRLSSR